MEAIHTHVHTLPSPAHPQVTKTQPPYARGGSLLRDVSKQLNEPFMLY